MCEDFRKGLTQFTLSIMETFLKFANTKKVREIRFARFDSNLGSFSYYQSLFVFALSSYFSFFFLRKYQARFSGSTKFSIPCKRVSFYFLNQKIYLNKIICSKRF